MLKICFTHSCAEIIAYISLTVSFVTLSYMHTLPTIHAVIHTHFQRSDILTYHISRVPKSAALL